MSRTKKKPSAWNKIAGASMKACRIQAGDSTAKFSSCLSTRLKAAAKEYGKPQHARKSKSKSKR